MRQSHLFMAGLVLLGALAGCQDFLSVENENNPNTDKVFERPVDVQQLIGNTYIQVHNSTLGGSNDALQPQLLSMALESYSQLGNFGMGIRAGWPRVSINNQRGNQTQAGNLRDWSGLSRAARAAANGIAAFSDPAFTTGNVAQDTRDRAFAWFSLGTALGNLALSYDSGTAISPLDSLPYIVPIVGHDSVMRAALNALDSAVAIGESGSMSNVDAAWLMNSPTYATWSPANFAKLARSYRARFRAGVARTPDERAAVDWDKVIDDAENGIDADFILNIDRSEGYDLSFPIQHYLFDTWHQMPTPYIGMADSSGGYDDWLATPTMQRGSFLIRTADKRFPSGDTRPDQNDASPEVPDPTGRPYFRNRPPGNDRPGDPWALSYYDFYRFYQFFKKDRRGDYPVMTKAEIDLLAAEGYIRKGNVDAAARLIDKTRTVRGELPALEGAVTTVTDPVPGGQGCVPRVPQAPSFTSTACGNIMEAMKWEKRMETAFTGYGMWYFDSRGWGDLSEGTAMHFPIPYQELDTRALPYYDLGGVGGTDAVPRGTYGF